MFHMDKIIYLDIDTICAFMKKGGTLYKPETEKIKNNLKIITELAKQWRIKIISLQDHHYGDEKHAFAEGELKVNGGPFDLHADMESGEMCKIRETSLPLDRVTFSTDLQITDNVLVDLITENLQLIFEKQSISGFYSNQNPGGNPVLIRAVNIIDPEDIFVYGVYTEYCVQENVDWFRLNRNKCNIWIIKDAIVPYDMKPGDGDRALKDMAQIGCRFITTEAFKNLLKNNFG